MSTRAEETIVEKEFSNFKKAVISILLGLAGFLGAYFSLNFSAGNFSLSMVWSSVFPLMAAMAYGSKFGLLAGTVGLGAFFPFHLWPNNGWANFSTVFGYLQFFAWHGYFAVRRSKFSGPWFDPLIIQLPSVFFYGVLIYFLYPPCFSFNPPFWAPDAQPFMPPNIISGIALKSPLIMCMATIFSAFVLIIPEIRLLLGLPAKKCSRGNGPVFIATVSSSLAAWLLMIVFDDIFIGKGSPGFFPLINSPFEIIAFVIIMSAGLAAGYAISLVLEKRYTVEERLRESEETLRTTFENMIDGILVANLRTEKFMIANKSLCSMLGYTIDEIFSLGVGDIHPPQELDYVRDIFDRQARGELVLASNIPVLRKDGTVFFADINSTFVRIKGEPCVLGVFHDITGRRKAAEALKASLAEKDVLLKELYHRTKNNMQVITSMLALQAKAGDDEKVKRVFTDITAKIKAMSLVHQKLYQSQELSSINLGEYAGELARFFVHIYERKGLKINLNENHENISALIDLATPFGLILSELLANSMKHAFAGRSEGTISVSLSKQPQGVIKLHYSDDGAGLAAGFDPREQSGLGLKTIIALAEHQLQGSIEFSAAAGFGCTLKLAADNYKPRV
jgi:PAS domain S-box-containing protein